ncbi:MAG: hypothetical protein JWP44_5136 [Mucilaginibacter sp.]|nr:hypothetical protein [Mucilaginibacter sp.]
MDNVTWVLTTFTKELNAPVNAQLLKDELSIHPDYPSLLAISDVLSTFNFENVAFSVDVNDFIHIAYPFIAHTNINGGDFVIVDKVENENIYISNETQKQQLVSLENFKESFSGVVLTAEPAEATTNAIIFSNNLKKLKLPVIITFSICVLIGLIFFDTNYFINFSWLRVVLTALKSAGVIISILLLIHSIDTDNPYIKKICQAGSKIDCNTILSSKAAIVFDGLTWSEVGFYYFTGTLLIILFSANSIFVWRILFILNFISLPYTFYSFYYQSRIAKQWCILCCIVQALLWLEFVPLLIYTIKNPVLNNIDWAKDTTNSIICLFAPISFWRLTKPLFSKLKQVPLLKEQLRKTKYSRKIFNTHLYDQPKCAQPAREWSIVLGKENAKNVITVVTNPYCGPCALMHKQLDELINQNNELEILVVFATPIINDDRITKTSRYLMEIYSQYGKMRTKEAMQQWYEQKHRNFDEWSKNYPIISTPSENKMLEHQKEWCQISEIKFTPTILINGFQLPELYNLLDLKYLLD